MRGGAGVARWAHNPKVVGSNPAPATKKAKSKDLAFCFYKPWLIIFNKKAAPKNEAAFQNLL